MNDDRMIDEWRYRAICRHLDSLGIWPSADADDVTASAELEKMLAQNDTALPPLLGRLLRAAPKQDFEKRIVARLVEEAPWGSEIAIFRFLDASTKAVKGAASAYRFHSRGRTMPVEMVPFAADDPGNLFAVAVNGPRQGTVWFWDHEHREYTGPRFPQVAEEVEAAGIDCERLDVHQIIIAWHRLHPDAMRGEPGYSNLYLAAPDLFSLFMALEGVPT